MNSWYLFRTLVLCLVPSILWAQAANPVEPARELPVAVAATHGNLRYVGRFDHNDPAGPRCAWSASTVIIRFQGSALNVRFRSTGHDFWQVIVDGKPDRFIEIIEGQPLYSVVESLSVAEHTVELVKRTEFNVGATQFLGFQLSAEGKILPAPAAPSRRIEVIGDSISCGYGNEAPTKEEKFTPRAENASITYGALAARQLSADYVCVAWSGKKLWPNNSILDFYGDILPKDQNGAAWDFASWKPDVVVINLGTNDFGLEDPEGAGWMAAYRSLLKRLRNQYPDATIYCALGTMLGDWPAPRKPATTIRHYLNALISEFESAGDRKVRFIDFGTQKPENGYGGSWHPSAKTHQLMAAQLVARLQKDLGW
jgi:lysophospholipase L1-like esterase